MADPGSPGPASIYRPQRSSLRLGSLGQFLGVAPFILFAILFLIIPTINLAISAFYDNEGHLTLQNILDLARPQIVAAYLISIRVSLASA